MPGKSFHREEKLKSRKTIEQLFAGAQSIKIYPFRLVWAFTQKHSEKYPVQLGVSISKKRIKRAVDRNLIRRRTQESYRCNKHILIESICHSQNIALMLIYLPSTIMDFSQIDKGVQDIIKALLLEFNKES